MEDEVLEPHEIAKRRLDRLEAYYDDVDFLVGRIRGAIQLTEDERPRAIQSLRDAAILLSSMKKSLAADMAECREEWRAWKNDQKRPLEP